MYRLDVLVGGYPGRSLVHGGLGWSTVALLHGGGRLVLVDTGPYAYRDVLPALLAARGLAAGDITDVLLTHCHWDHIVNTGLFPHARLHVPAADLAWARAQPVGTWSIPELHVEALARDPRAVPVEAGAVPVPGVVAIATPGHTPGHLAYIAAGEDGELILCGDAVKNRDELLTGRVAMTLDAEASRASIELLRRRLLDGAGARMVCGHDSTLVVVDGRVVRERPIEAEIAAATGEPEAPPRRYPLVR